MSKIFPNVPVFQGTVDLADLLAQASLGFRDPLTAARHLALRIIACEVFSLQVVRASVNLVHCARYEPSISMRPGFFRCLYMEPCILATSLRELPTTTTTDYLIEEANGDLWGCKCYPPGESMKRIIRRLAKQYETEIELVAQCPSTGRMLP